MNLLIVLPGGIDKSSEYKVIPAIETLCHTLSREHNICVVTLHQHDSYCEYKKKNLFVISVPFHSSKNFYTCFKMIKTALKKHTFVPDIVHGFWLRPSLFSALFSRTYNVPLIATIGGGEPVSLVDIAYGGEIGMKGRIVNKLSILLADVLTCGSKYTANIVNSAWKEETEIIALGIDLDFWQQKKNQLFEKKSQYNLVHIASINRVKAPYDLLKTITILKDKGFPFHLHWVGEDTLDGQIQKKANELGLDNVVTFHGFQTQSQLKQLLKVQDFILQTSLYESQGVAMIEASSQGVCPVGTNVGWLHDMQMGIGEGDTPLLIANEVMKLSTDNVECQNRIKKTQSWNEANDVYRTADKFNIIYQRLYYHKKIKQ